MLKPLFKNGCKVMGWVTNSDVLKGYLKKFKILIFFLALISR
jgi:hypothetical protein